MLKANLLNSKNYQGTDLDKLNRTLSMLETSVNSEKFQAAILNFEGFEFVRYKCLGPVKFRKIHLKQFSNAEVYDKIMKGHRQENTDSFMDMQLVLSEGNGGSAIGETDGNDVTTTYRSAFLGMKDGEFAAHLMHEWTHTLGFEHSFSNNCDENRDCLSVPYAIGNIIEVILTGNCWYNCKYANLNK
jgi:hypothetical protein